ncbi:MAG: hypothetical protein HRT58_04425 [Crocinitomicaceae bacterium]|nr:hypothetical protein [Flavobacteriales bacterium]NQZ34882.1 hypothetical protein [Crocinitomicaceae bacterium]
MAPFKISILAKASIGDLSVVLVVDKTGVHLDLGGGAIPVISSEDQKNLPLKLPNLEITNLGVGYRTVPEEKGFYSKGVLAIEGVGKIGFPISDLDFDSEQSNTNSQLQTQLEKGQSALSKRIKIEKSIGPITLHAIKVSAENFTPSISIITSFKMAGLTFKLIDFGVDFSLAIPPKPKGVSLAGLELSYDKGAVEIGGAFLKEKGKESYLGSALIKTKTFSITALGGLDLSKDDPSFFIYAVLNKALGGPPFFMVTGLAAGLGINRKLNIPPIAELEKFPLIAAATNVLSGEKLLEELIKGNYLPNSSGNMWFAIGVKFTSFKLVDSIALLTIAIGDEFAMHILGVSKVTIGDGTNNFIYAKMLMKASYIPDQGFLGIEARLASGSYVLQKSCRLEGGFAYYQWFSGDHKDDFVLSWGGYHPAYEVPSHYPTPPRLSINWPITRDLRVKGMAYMAITPTHLMAGGRLEAVWKKGNIRAWFNIDANFLIQWRPFQYQADFRVSIGASFRIKVAFIKVKMSISVNVAVRVSGPPFAGRAVIDLKLISFTIPFGKRQTVPKHISWKQFKDEVLPTEINIPSATEGLLTDLEAERKANKVSSTLSDSKLQWIVDPESFNIEMKFAIPFKTWENDGASQAGLSSGSCDTGFGLYLLGKAGDKVKSKVHYTLKREGSGSVMEGIKINAKSTKMPRALWAKSGENGLNEQSSLCLKNILSIVPKEIRAGESKEFTLDEILYDPEDNANHEKPLFKSSTLTVLEPGDNHVDQEEMKNINHSVRRQKRNDLISELSNIPGLGIELMKEEDINLSSFEDYKEGRFWDWPMQYDSSSR